MPRRCHWARGEPDIPYHDAEWPYRPRPSIGRAIARTETAPT